MKRLSTLKISSRFYKGVGCHSFIPFCPRTPSSFSLPPPPSHFIFPLIKFTAFTVSAIFFSCIEKYWLSCTLLNHCSQTSAALSWTHHLLTASLEQGTALMWLAAAETNITLMTFKTHLQSMVRRLYEAWQLSLCAMTPNMMLRGLPCFTALPLLKQWTYKIL